MFRVPRLRWPDRAGRPERSGRLLKTDRGLVKLAIAALVAVVFVGGPTAALAGPTSTPVGYDISYPQCPASFPASPAFGVVGVNNGIVYDANPCLSAEYAWAKGSTSTTQAHVQFYANTGNPGPVLSQHWPTNQTFPQPCDGSWNTACSYDYGWNAAADSFKDAVGAAGNTAAASVPWWLDVESANSWSTDPSLNISALRGAVAYLTTPAVSGGAGVGAVGFYSNSSSWASIVGSKSVFANYSSWVPGARTLKQAKSNCSASFTGGPVKYAQYLSGGFDADYPCF